MKKIIVAIYVISLFTVSAGYGQNRSISFIEKPWSEILSMAKSQNKLIFLDAYTSWCGPCKWMAANMFTNDTIADFYNKTFICAHFDMEKGEGPTLSRFFQVKAYPTLLFISTDGEMIHKRVGAPQKVNDYLEMGTAALTPGEGFAACEKKYHEGNRDPKFMMRYFDRLQGAYMPVTEPLSAYFSTLQEKDLVKPDNWQIIFRFVNDMNSREFIYLQKNHAEFEKLYTSDSVYQKLFNVYGQSLSMLTRSRTFSEADYNTLKQKIRDSGFKDADKVIFTVDMNLFQMRSEQEKYFNLVNDGLITYYGSDYAILNQVAIYILQISDEKQHLEKAADWAKKSIALKSTPQNNNTYASLMFKLGDKNMAVKYEKVALDLAIKEKVATQEYEDNLKKFSEK